MRCTLAQLDIALQRFKVTPCFCRIQVVARQVVRDVTQLCLPAQRLHSPLRFSHDPKCVWAPLVTLCWQR